MSLTFADTHNIVAYLNKSNASEGFHQVIDFLNGSYIKYALTVKPNIYVSCIKQFWNTVVVKQTDDITRLQALVDRKKVVIMKAAIRDVLRLDEVEGVDCLPNEEIFSMSAKRASWNEFSSTMASAVICLSTEKGFSGVEIPLFKGMLVAGVIKEEGDAEEQVQDDVNEAAAQGADNAEALDACVAFTRRVEHLEYDKVAQALEIIKLKRMRIDTSEDTMMKDASNQGRMIDDLDKDDAVTLMNDKEEEKKEEEVKDDQVQRRQAEIYKIDMDHASKVLSMHEDEPDKVQEVVDVVTTAKLITEVVTAASITISAAEPQVLAAAITTAALVRVVAASTRRRKGVVIRDPEEESTIIIPADTKSKDKGKGIMVEDPKPLKKKQQIEMDEEYARKLHEELNKDIDWDVAIEHVKQKAKEDPAVQRYQVMKKRPQTEAQARKNMIMYLKNVVGFRLDYFKGMSYDDIRPIFEAKFNSNIEFLLNTKEQLEEEENRAIQSINKTPAQKAAKRRKLNEEVEDLKKHLEIVPDEDDDVYTKATLLARKGLVKEIFSTSKPNNFSDDFLLTTLGAMFERPDGQAQVWKNQRTVHGQTKVKSWKLLESCGVHIITFTTTQLILPVERRYPLSRFTLDQMLNAVRLKLEEQSEMSLELLRFTRQQHQKGQLE
nr:hypothetical protein [Tanacetum cinerariifolium]